MDAKGNAVLCDFGCSRIRHEISRPLSLDRTVGRSFFVARALLFAEVLRSTEFSDIYSFAMTIYMMGTGEKPFTNVNGMQAALTGLQPKCPDSLGGLSLVQTVSLYSVLQQI